MRSLHRYVLSTNQSSFSSFFVVLSRGRPLSCETSRVRRNNRCCSPSTPAAFCSSKEWCTHRRIAVHFVYPGACRRCSRFLSRCSRLFFIAFTRVGRLPTRVTKQCPLPVRMMTSGRRKSYFQLLFIITFNIGIK